MKAATGHLMNRSEALSHLDAVGWKEVLSAAGPVPVAEWAEHGFSGELLRFETEGMAVETCGREDCDHIHGVWKFGNFSS